MFWLAQLLIGLGFRVEGSELRVEGLEFGDCGSGFGVGLRTLFWLARLAILIEQPDAHPLFCVPRFGCGVKGLRFGVWGLRFGLGARIWFTI